MNDYLDKTRHSATRPFRLQPSIAFIMRCIGPLTTVGLSRMSDSMNRSAMSGINVTTSGTAYRRVGALNQLSFPSQPGVTLLAVQLKSLGVARRFLGHRRMRSADRWK
mgnify:CR=1 FL=1